MYDESRSTTVGGQEYLIDRTFDGSPAHYVYSKPDDDIGTLRHIEDKIRVYTLTGFACAFESGHGKNPFSKHLIIHPKNAPIKVWQYQGYGWFKAVFPVLDELCNCIDLLDILRQQADGDILTMASIRRDCARS